MTPSQASIRRPATSDDAGRLAALNLMEDAVQARQRAEALNAGLRESERRLERALLASQHLHSASAYMIEGGSDEVLYLKLVDSAVAIMQSDMGSMQIVDEQSDALRLLAWKGFDPAFEQMFDMSCPDAKTPCAVAGRIGQRVIVPDVEACDFLAGTPDLEALRAMGVRAVQSTPLFTRSGRLVGMISTHWRNPHMPAESDLRFLDVLARQAADLMERRSEEDGAARSRRASEDALREADRRKNEFLAMLAHELRGPLAPIRNGLQVLRMSEARPDDVASVTAIMERQLGHMARLIDDLIDVSRISRGKLQLRKEPTELTSIARSVAEATKPICDAMRHELRVTLPPEPIYVDADPTRLAQVVDNLLHNACKFTNAGGRISLIVEREGEEVVIRVRDTGIGISADYLPRIFDLFTQVDSSIERTRGGLGIGLSLVKDVVEMHDGSVTAESAGPEQGSEFIVRLPILANPIRPSRPKGSAKAEGGTSRRILVVDDNRDSTESLGLLLTLKGHEVHAVHDGLAAVEEATRLRPDLVLLDIGLPGLNGFEVARRIREQPGGEGMKLVALTGWGQEEYRRRSLEAGFDFHLVKPVAPEDLDRLLRTLVTRESM